MNSIPEIQDTIYQVWGRGGFPNDYYVQYTFMCSAVALATTDILKHSVLTYIYIYRLHFKKDVSVTSSHRDFFPANHVITRTM